MRARMALLMAVTAAVLSGCAAMHVPGAEATGDGTYIFTARATAPIAKQGDELSLLEARMAASVMAKANLVERIAGGVLTSEATVDALMFETQAASAVVEGTLSRAAVEFEEPDGDDEPTSVTAVATLELTRRQLRKLEAYVE